jgi:ATP-dependent DNA helicase PIF1
MRANAAICNIDNLPNFPEWLIELGDGRLGHHLLPDGIFEIPPICVVKDEENSTPMDDICNAIFPKEIKPEEIDLIANRAILTPINEDSLKIREKILKRIEPAQPNTKNSIDSIAEDGANNEENENYSLEFLNSLTPGGMPPHELNLKIGAVVILLRNLDPTRALCNGTRMVVKQIMSRLIDCEVLTGSSKGTRVFVPRIILAPSESELPFILKRKQFPIRLAFAMTINKSQGQTLDQVGIYLPAPVFSHGQLYTAFSRTKSFQQVKVKILPTDEQGNLLNDERVFTKNVVYKEVFAE